MGTYRGRLLVVAFCLLAVAAAHPADSPTKAEGYYKALYNKISLQLTKEKDGGPPTLELAVAWVCKKAEVPYQVKRSRELAGDKVKMRVAPINYTDVVAGQAVVTLAAQAGLVMMVDNDGVYLMPKPDAPAGDPPGRQALSLNQRLQLGRLLQVEVAALHGKDIDHQYWREKEVDQQTQLRIKVTPTAAFDNIKVVAHVYARILRHSRDSSRYEDDDRPHYGPDKDFVEIFNETIEVSGLTRLQPREIKTKAASTSYEVYDRWYSTDRRYGEKYYGFVVDFYVGDQLIKSVTSAAKLYELLERDSRTGFPYK
jgi:hypothetical protein